MVESLNCGYYEEKKGLPFFIDLAKKSNKNNYFYEELLLAISANPNITKEQFYNLFSNIPTEDIIFFHHYKDFTPLVKSLPEKQKLEWMWDIAKKVDFSDNPNLLVDVGSHILKRLDENDDLRIEVTDCFTRLKGKRFYSKNQKTEWPVFAYSILIEILMKSEQDMNKFDEHFDNYEKARWRFNDFEYDWDLYKNLAQNPYLDDERTRKIFDDVKKIPDEMERAIVMQELLSQSHISEELFDEMFEYRREIKFVTLWNRFYVGASKNTTHIGKVSKYLHKYVKKLLNGDRYLVFAGMAQNQSLPLEQVDKLISFLEKETQETGMLRYGNMPREMFHVFTGLLVRKDLGNERTKKILTIFFDYLDKHNDSEREHGTVHQWMYRTLNLSEFRMDDEIFTFFTRRARVNVHKYYLLAQLLSNVNLTERQFDEINKILYWTYFESGVPLTQQSSINRILYFWISNKYFK